MCYMYSGMGTDERSWYESLSMLFSSYPGCPLVVTSSDHDAATEDVKFLLSSFSNSISLISTAILNPFGSNLKETRMRNRNRIIRSNQFYTIVQGKAKE